MEIEDFLAYMFIIAFITAFVLTVTTKFMDMKVEKISADQSRAAINMMHLIATSSPLLVRDGSGLPMKAMFNKTSGMDPKQNLTGCCDTTQYSYNFSVGNKYSRANDDVVSGSRQFPYFDANSYCYISSNLLRMEKSDMPANLCKDQFECPENTIAALNLTDTPLSELTYWLSRACTETDDFNKTVIFDTSEIKRICLADNSGNCVASGSSSKVCVKFADNSIVCKRYSCGAPVQIDNNPPNGDELKSQVYKPYGTPGPEASCVLMRVRSQGGFVYLEMPEFIRTGRYVWIAPNSCYARTWLTGLTCSSHNGVGDIIASERTCIGSLSESAACAWSLSYDKQSDTVNYDGGNNNRYSNANKGDKQVSSASVNNHGYIWAAGLKTVGSLESSYRYAAECCLGSSCNDKQESGVYKDGNRVNSANILNPTTIDVPQGGNKNSFADMFNNAWCGDASNKCLLCAKDQSDTSNTKTKWYVCGGIDMPSGSGAENIKNPTTVIEGYKCTSDGWVTA